jgi:NAD-dependent DNA ligase
MSDIDIKSYIDTCYENGNPVVDDEEYDAMFGSQSSALHSSKGGAKKLPVWMGSLNKVKTEQELLYWKKKNNTTTYVVSGKLDGCSALLVREELYESCKLYSRGNGLTGTDWTHVIEHTLNFPVSSDFTRCELVMKKLTFDMKYKHEFKNPRNLVAGQLASKTPKLDILRDIDLVPYEIMSGKTSSNIDPETQMHICHSNQKGVLPWTLLKHDEVSVKTLSDLLDKWSQSSLYHLDGLVVTVNSPYIQNQKGNPSYSVAFKKDTSENQKIATVIQIHWDVSAWGSFIPVVEIEPIVLGGVTISRVSGYNAKFIKQECIGPGAVVLCTRSGDVIPKIQKVVKRSDNLHLPEGEWEGVHLMDTNGVNKVKLLYNLVQNLAYTPGFKPITGLGPKTLEKLYKEHGLTDLFYLINAPRTMSCFKGKSGSNIYAAIVQIKCRTHSLARVIGASGTLSKQVGEQTVAKLLAKFDLLNKCPSVDEIVQIDGFSHILATKVVENYFQMISFVNKCKTAGLCFAENTPTKKPKICVSGFRDPILEKKYDISQIPRDCVFLVVKNTGQETTKTKLARKFHIPIVKLEDVLNDE